MERYERPVDEKIPFYWRREFKKFTGVEPLYEEYERHPDLWQKEPTFTFRFKLLIVIFAVIILLGSFMYKMKEEKKKENTRINKEFFNDSKSIKTKRPH